MLNGDDKEFMFLPEEYSEHMLALEGLLVALSKLADMQDSSMDWVWPSVLPIASLILVNAKQEPAGLISSLSTLANQSSDHLRISTSNKV